MADKKTKTKVLRPIFDNEQDIIELPREKIIDDAMFSFGIISDCSLEDHEAVRLAFKQVIFNNVLFNKITFRHIELVKQDWALLRRKGFLNTCVFTKGK